MDAIEVGNEDEAKTTSPEPELLITESFMAFTYQFREQYHQKSVDYKRKCLLIYYNETRLDYIPTSLRTTNQWTTIPGRATPEEQSGKKICSNCLNNLYIKILFLKRLPH